MAFRKSVFAVLMSSFLLGACVPAKTDSQKQAETNASPLSPVDKNSPHITTTDELRLYDSADGLDLNSKEQCVESVCGAPPQLDPAKEASAKILSDQLMQRLRPQIANLVRVNAAASDALQKRILSQRSQIEHLTPEPKYAAMLNLLWALSYFKQVSAAWDQDQNMLKHEKFMQLLPPNVSQNNAVAIETMINHYLSSSDIEESSYISVVGLEKYFENKTHSTDPTVIHQAIRDYATTVRTRIEAIKRQFPALTIEISPATISLSKGEDIDSVGTRSFTKDIGNAAFDHVFGDDIATYTQVTPDLVAAMSKFATDASPVFARLNTPAGLSQSLKQAFDSCGKVSMHIARLRPIAAPARANANAIIEIVRTYAARVADGFTTNPSVQDQLHKKISSVQFAMPEPPDFFIKRIDASLQAQLINATDRQSIVQTATLSDLSLYAAAANISDVKEYNDVAETCDNADPDMISDSSISAMGFINVSWPTLNDPSSAYTVIAHEFGHIVSHALREIQTSYMADPTFYSETYACVQQRQLGKNTTPTQEEDFADLFSARVGKLLESQNIKVGDDACLLLRDSDGANRYGTNGGLSMKWPASDEYSHSPTFYRLIQHEIDRGHQLTPACSAIMMQTLPTMRNQCSSVPR